MSGHTWVPYVAVAAGVCLVAKGVLIIASGNAVADAPMAALYLGGLLLGLVAAVGAGLRQRGLLRSIAVGGGSALLLIAWIMGLGDALKPLVATMSSAEHVQAEVPVVIGGLVLVLLALRARAHDTHPEPEPALA